MTLDSIDEIVAIDFEFRGGANKPEPVCGIAHEIRSGIVHRMWLEGERERWRNPPFPHGPNVAITAYYASAELGCYTALGWPFPRFVIDLYAEFRIHTNGLYLPHGKGLYGAMRYFGYSETSTERKEYMRHRILNPPYTAGEPEEFMDYCEEDVNGLKKLLPRLIANDTNLIPILWRGEYMKVMADAETAGIPIDGRMFDSMKRHWKALRLEAIKQISGRFPIFEGKHLRSNLFAQLLDSKAASEEAKLWPKKKQWPLTPNSSLSLSDATLEKAAEVYPVLTPLRQTRQMLSKLRKLSLTVGNDNRNRCLLSAFSTSTGRNAPSTTKFVFGLPRFMRGLIRAEPGKALAYLDWGKQEVGVAAALSGDPAMKAMYRSVDPYLFFAHQAGVVPADATAETHPHARKQFKAVVLGVQYMISPMGLARRIDGTLNEGEKLLGFHHRSFPQFWEWNESVSDCAQLTGELTARLGWKIRVSPGSNLRSIKNFPMQANGAEMLRLACVWARDAFAAEFEPEGRPCIVATVMTPF
jgi:DNA polymerase I-like protein with 3'-5' exonuclease and polymerase domains